MIVMKAEQAARESRLTKQDRYAEMRRRKDEEREAKERMLVSDHFLCVCVCVCVCTCGKMWDSLLRNFAMAHIGRRSHGSKGQGGGSCCIRV